MDPIWVKVLEQAPSLGVFSWLIVHVLKHMKEVAQMVADNEHERTESLKDVIDRNTRALERNTEILGRSLYIVERNNHGNGVEKR